MAEIFWYYARDEQQFGPVTSAELKRLASVDELSADDLVWREGMDEWAPAVRVKGLFPPREAGPHEGEASALRENASAPGAIPPLAVPPVANLAATAVIAAPATTMHSAPVEAVSPPPPPPAASADADRAAQPRAAQPSAARPISAPRPPATPAAEGGALSPGLRTALIATQGVLWATCVMVVILGGAIFMITMVGAKSKADQADSAQVSAALFIGAYALARAGERVCLLLERYLSTRRP